MHLCDMKKITVIASLLILFTACEKADIRPNVQSSEPTVESRRSAIPTTGSRDGGSTSSANSLNAGRTGSTSADPGTSNPTDPAGGGGEITDPLRKKDQKDNK